MNGKIEEEKKSLEKCLPSYLTRVLSLYILLPPWIFIMSRDGPDRNDYGKGEAYKTAAPYSSTVLQPPCGAWGGEGLKPQDTGGKCLGCFNFTALVGVERTLCVCQK